MPSPTFRDQPPGQNSSATYTVADLARLLQCSERHIHRLKDAAAIPGVVRFGRLIRFSKPVIDAWLAAGVK